MESLWRAAMGSVQAEADDYDGVEFWGPSERAGWLTKQGKYIKTWRRRCFVLKQGKVFRFKESMVTRASRPRGVISVANLPYRLVIYRVLDNLLIELQDEGYVSRLGSSI
ncbi:pleckstrin homology domain-containing protein 1 [Phtheirospermum japonicum]|uniref:Pleckstrin homology domain-containing protein 1 n=1 Tax=Phtheirospermum japonicum TaxID=374723 RepID=A0A830CJE7_9LAMI|nr:pleckstrin homology domain-containing protein 1 [Phtheirospermum japonicum]